EGVHVDVDAERVALDHRVARAAGDDAAVHRAHLAAVVAQHAERLERRADELPAGRVQLRRHAPPVEGELRAPLLEPLLPAVLSDRTRTLPAGAAPRLGAVRAGHEREAGIDEGSRVVAARVVVRGLRAGVEHAERAVVRAEVLDVREEVGLPGVPAPDHVLEALDLVAVALPLAGRRGEVGLEVEHLPHPRARARLHAALLDRRVTRPLPRPHAVVADPERHVLRGRAQAGERDVTLA